MLRTKKERSVVEEVPELGFGMITFNEVGIKEERRGSGLKHQTTSGRKVK